MTLVPAIISEENLGGGASLIYLFSRLQVVNSLVSPRVYRCINCDCHDCSGFEYESSKVFCLLV